MSYANEFTHAQHAAAHATDCNVCDAKAGSPCTGLAGRLCHAARVHMFLAANRPMPTPHAIAELTRIDGMRADTKPFIHWMSGEYELRIVSAMRTSASTMQVCHLGTNDGVCFVRRALVDIAVTYGLMIPIGQSGRGRMIVTPRGVEFHRAGGQLAAPARSA